VLPIKFSTGLLYFSLVKFDIGLLCIKEVTASLLYIRFNISLLYIEGVAAGLLCIEFSISLLCIEGVTTSLFYVEVIAILYSPLLE